MGTELNASIRGRKQNAIEDVLRHRGGSKAAASSRLGAVGEDVVTNARVAGPIASTPTRGLEFDVTIAVQNVLALVFVVDRVSERLPASIGPGSLRIRRIDRRRTPHNTVNGLRTRVHIRCKCKVGGEYSAEFVTCEKRPRNEQVVIAIRDVRDRLATGAHRRRGTPAAEIVAVLDREGLKSAVSNTGWADEDLRRKVLGLEEKEKAAADRIRGQVSAGRGVVVSEAVDRRCAPIDEAGVGQIEHVRGLVEERAGVTAVFLGVGIHQHRQADLLQSTGTRDPTASLTHAKYGREQKRDQDNENPDHDQQLDDRKAPATSV
jgi:hypothetical protein